MMSNWILDPKPLTENMGSNSWPNPNDGFLHSIDLFFGSLVMAKTLVEPLVLFDYLELL